jgi:2-oxoisovalerate dehydrogenase E1 component alpha subunit
MSAVNAWAEGWASLERKDPVQLLDPSGILREEEEFPLPLGPEEILGLWRAMVVGRRLDRTAVLLTRQGELGVYASSAGQEACQIGAVAPLRATDWLFPTYRDSVAVMQRGVPPAEVLALYRGSWHGGYDVARYRTAPMATPIATQTLHAAGLAMAARMRGDPVATLAFLGDGGTSEGEAHEALNFAAVFEAGLVVFVQNNGWAISVPVTRQARAPIAWRAVGYGMPGVRVDGNDVLACYAVTAVALERARRGEGPTLIEAMTYRMEAHTTADDPSRYRSAEEVEAWRARDPIDRLERYLRAAGVLDDAGLQAVSEEAEEAAAALRRAVRSGPPEDPLEVFERVFSEPTPQLGAERAELAARLAAAREGAAQSTVGGPA